MQSALNFRTNRDLFSNYYLDEHLPETEEWNEVSDKELQSAYNEIQELWDREKSTAPKRNESQLEEKFIRPMFRKLGISFEVEESTSRTQRRPDYGFFETEEVARSAFERREEGDDFYRNSVAVADAKRWGRPLDTRGSGEHERDFENPSYQIHVYLQETPARWAVLTNGQKWRLYYAPTSHRLDSYYEVDFPTIIESGDLEAFKYFYLFFRHEAFLEDSGGDCFLDDVYDESNIFARELGEDLQDNIYEAIKVLSEGFLQYPDNELDEDDLGLIHDSSLIFLYRLIFVLYAEAEGRELLDTTNEIYEESYSLNSLKQEVAEELDSANPKFRDWQDDLWSRLDELFRLIDQGSKSRGIPEEDLYIPAYNGGLFRTNPDENDSPEAQFLAVHQVGDSYLAKVIELLTRSRNGNVGGKIFVDYSSLEVRHLGSIYEGLLEYQLNIADEPLALNEGEFVEADDDDTIAVQKGEVFLTTDSGERKTSGSYYTPEYVVEYIVENTFDPLVNKIYDDLLARDPFDKEGGSKFAQDFAEQVFNLKILDPAMGSGHFLTNTVDYLARQIIEAQERQAAQEGIESVDEKHDINWARRQVAQRCIYGVDLNPLAVELAKVSLWLRTLAAEQPLAFLDHHLKTGNSLVGSDIEDIEELESESGGDGNATLADFGIARKGTIEQLMRIYQDFIAIENQDLADVKEMESKYDEFERNKLRQRLEAMANVHTADQFGTEGIPSDAYKRMASSLEDEVSWKEISEASWFRNSQMLAKQGRFFHWSLEFPEVFYNQDGAEASNPGFDAVIGNPPYVRVQNLDHDLIDYLKKEYEVAYRRIDVSLMFFELATELCKMNGRASYISSLQFRNSTYGEKLREFLAKQKIHSIVDFGDLPVFEDATTYAGIIGWEPSQQSNNQINYTKVNSLSDELIDALRNESDSDAITRYKTTLLPDEEWTFTSSRQEALIDELETHPRLTRFAESCTGMFTGRDEIFLFDPEEAEDSDIENEIFLDVIRGGDPNRWHLPQASKKSIYPYEEVNGETRLLPVSTLQSEYPNAYEYLVSHKEELAERLDSRKNIDGDDWYKLTRPGRIPIFNSRKIVTSGESKQNQFCIDENGSGYSNARVFSVVPDKLSAESLLGILNSKVAEFYLHSISRIKRGGYYSYSCSYLDQLPIPSSIDEELEERVKEIRDLTAERYALNLNLKDYLGEYSEGESLGEMYMPASNLHETVLVDTTGERENLRLGKVSLDREDGTVNLYATARYKPADPEGSETDQWGYTETDPILVMQFVGLSHTMERLLLDFVPMAVDEGDGFAGFRETATKTQSLIDRLGDIKLPELSDVEDGVNRYIEIYSKAEKLDQEISQLETTIDKLVYEMYGLSKEQIELVESSVED